MSPRKHVVYPYSTFLSVKINFHSGVATGVKNLTSVDLQDRHDSGSAEETNVRGISVGLLHRSSRRAPLELLLTN